MIALIMLQIAAAPKRPQIVTIAQIQPVKITAGGNAEARLELSVLKGFHIQANPASEPFLIAATIKIESPDSVVVGETVYPPGVPFRLKGSGKDISTYEGDIVISIPLKADESAKSDEVLLKGVLRYQGCDATKCFPPTNVPFELKVIIE